MAKVNRLKVDYDKIYESKYDGPYKIIKEIESDDKRHRKALIQFLETGNIQEAKLDKAVYGIVRDRLKHTPDFDKVYESNTSGPYKILEILEERKNGKIMCKVQFIETGTIIEAYLHVALEGGIRDPYRISVCGFGITGNNDTKTREYMIWHSMIARCYNQNAANYHLYGAKGVTVCERWRYFDNFLIDIVTLPGYDLWIQYPGEYALDKDMRQINVPEYLKVYSPDTCCFISIVENAKYVGVYLNIHKENVTSKYMGVYKKPNGNFEVNITVNGIAYNFSTYTLEEAAAAMYNYVSLYYYPNINHNLLNNVPYMTLDEINSYRVRVKEMCTIVHK